MLLAAALAMGQANLPWNHLRHGEDVYVPSPVYPVAAASVYSRCYWSSDGSRLAQVDQEAEIPRIAERRTARGGESRTPMVVRVWSRDTGRTRTVYSADSGGINRVAFAGRDLVFTAGATERFWLARDGENARPLDLPVEAVGASLVGSLKTPNVAIACGRRLWMFGPAGLREIEVPKNEGISLFGRNEQNQTRVGLSGAGPVTALVLDLQRGTLSPSTDPEILWRFRPRGKFDVYVVRLNPERDEPADIATTGISPEDGGLRTELMELDQKKPRRIRFINESGSDVEVSPDGLSFAFVSNGVLMVRSMVRLDRRR